MSAAGQDSKTLSYLPFVLVASPSMDNSSFSKELILQIAFSLLLTKQFKVPLWEGVLSSTQPVVSIRMDKELGENYLGL